MAYQLGISVSSEKKCSYRTVQSMKENGVLAQAHVRAKVFRSGMMEAFMKATGSATRPVGMEDCCMLMAVSTTASG